jgi:Domain of unknown function (DUF4432)
MRQIVWAALFSPLLTLFPAMAMAKDFVLSDAETASRIDDWSVSSSDIGIAADPRFSVKKSILHGGKQEGVELIEVDNGRMTVSVIPTRGMNVFRVRSGDITLGWNSPVKQIVNPAYIELDSRGGLGWLDGFNEMLVRCGFDWAGHPGMDNGKLLSLHGRAGNTPASRVVVVIDDQPPHRIRVRGKVDEQVFKFTDYEMWTELSTEPGSRSFRVGDTLTNRGDYEREFQIIYHGNFGPPLLQEGSVFEAAVKQVTPFDDYAAKDIATWTTYRGPAKDYGEQVYNVVPFADGNDFTTVMLRDKAGDRGVNLRYNVAELPYFTLWKNTDTEKQGYVTGLEPGTGYAYNRSIERTFGRVPKLQAGASRSFTLDYTILTSKEDVAAAAKEIAGIRSGRQTQVDSQPQVRSENQ